MSDQFFDEARRLIRVAQQLQQEINRVLADTDQPLKLSIGEVGGPMFEPMLLSDVDSNLPDETKRDKYSSDGVTLGLLLARHAHISFLRGLIGVIETEKPDLRDV